MLGKVLNKFCNAVASDVSFFEDNQCMYIVYTCWHSIPMFILGHPILKLFKSY